LGQDDDTLVLRELTAQEMAQLLERRVLIVQKEDFAPVDSLSVSEPFSLPEERDNG
jgi:hypothetical protein